jgi:CheY-like chemotaxis protein
MANILLIDDDQDFSNFLREELLERGFSVEYADNAQSGLDRARSDDTLDIILLDYRMPGMNGLEFLAILKEERIKTATAWPGNIPIRWLTTLDSEPVRTETLTC